MSVRISDELFMISFYFFKAFENFCMIFIYIGINCYDVKFNEMCITINNEVIK